MNELHLSFEETELLRDLLAHAKEEVDKEVLHTDSREFKEKLKHRREVMEAVLVKISAVPVPA